MDSLGNRSDPIMGLSSFTAINNNISITLTDLIPNTMYFYYINSTNSVGSILSQVANFTTGLYQGIDNLIRLLNTKLLIVFP